VHRLMMPDPLPESDLTRRTTRRAT
jgi:hypothetical protein